MFSFFRFFHFWKFESYRVCQNQKHDITYSIIWDHPMMDSWMLHYISNILLLIRYISGVLLTCLILWGDHWISMLIHPQMQHSYMIKIPCIHCTYCITSHYISTVQKQENIFIVSSRRIFYHHFCIYLQNWLVDTWMVLVLVITVSKCRMSMNYISNQFKAYISVSPNVKYSADTYCTVHKLVWTWTIANPSGQKTVPLRYWPALDQACNAIDHFQDAYSEFDLAYSHCISLYHLILDMILWYLNGAVMSGTPYCSAGHQVSLQEQHQKKK